MYAQCRVGGRACAGCTITDECRDLIQKLLVAEPSQRLTIAGIFQHKWFLHDLPVGATTMNDRFVQAKPDGPGFQPLRSIEEVLSKATQDSGES
jgi:serine/threonine-protein kinase SRK2